MYVTRLRTPLGNACRAEQHGVVGRVSTMMRAGRCGGANPERAPQGKSVSNKYPTTMSGQAAGLANPIDVRALSLEDKPAEPSSESRRLEVGGGGGGVSATGL